MKKIFILSLAVALSGCQEYLVRSDLVSSHSGDAVARNASNQTIDPWPSYVYDTNIETSGERQSIAIKKYKQGPVSDIVGAGSPLTAVPKVDPAAPNS